MYEITAALQRSLIHLNCTLANAFFVNAIYGCVLVLCLSQHFILLEAIFLAYSNFFFLSQNALTKKSPQLL